MNDFPLPLGEMFGYTTNLRSMSQGRATSSMEFYRYEKVPSNVQEEDASHSQELNSTATA